MMVLNVNIEQVHLAGSLSCATCAIHTSSLEDIRAIMATQAHAQAHTLVYLPLYALKFPPPIEVVVETDSMIWQNQANVVHML
jgi:hypothetical protein